MEGFLNKIEEGEGLKGKIALHPLPLDAEQGRERWAPAVALAGGPGHGGGRDQGEKGEGDEGVRFPYSHQAEVVCGGRAEVAGYGRGGGAGSLEGGLGAVVVGVVGFGSGAWVLL